MHLLIDMATLMGLTDLVDQERKVNFAAKER